MDSDFTKMFHAIDNAKEKEQIYQAVFVEFNRVFAKAKAYRKKVDSLMESTGIINACKLFYYSKRYYSLIKQSKDLHRIASMRLKEWQLAMEKI